MGKKRRLKNLSSSGGKRIAPPIEPAQIDNLPILFSLEHCQNGKYCHSALDRNNKAAFADSIFKRRETNWDELRKAPRHGLGYEKIEHGSIKTKLPKIVAGGDKKTLFAFRFNGKAPMVGFRDRNVFCILYFDADFTLYDH